MIEQVYCISIISCLVIGMVLLLIQTAPKLHNRHYLNAKIFLGIASIIVALGNAVILWEGISEKSVEILSVHILVVSQLQACLFTFTSITLFHSPYVCKHNILRHLTPTFAFVILYALTVILLPDVKIYSHQEYWNNITNPGLLLRTLFAAVYLAQIIIYIRLYQREQRTYITKIDNYFSDTDKYQLRWASKLFYEACGVGIMVLIFCCFPSEKLDFILTIVITLLYLAFAIRFINYQYWIYYTIPAINNDVQQDAILPLPRTQEEDIEQMLRTQTLFLNQGVSLDEYAEAIGISARKLSAHINSMHGESFKRWVNRQRVEHAKGLISINPEQTIDEVAEASGFFDKSHFSRIFKDLTNISFLEYKNSKKNT